MGRKIYKAPPIRPIYAHAKLVVMTHKKAGFGPAPQTPEQRAVQASINQRREKAKAHGRKLSETINKITEEVVTEQLRRLRIDPFPTCPHCGTIFKGPATLYEGKPSKITMAAADRILRGVPLLD
jgi:hypothetical protein